MTSTMRSTSSSSATHLDPDLGDEVDRVLGAAVHLGVPGLAAEALHLGRPSCPCTPASFSASFTLVELERLDDGGDELHGFLSPESGRAVSPHAYAVSACRARSRPSFSCVSLMRRPIVRVDGRGRATHETTNEKTERGDRGQRPGRRAACIARHRGTGPRAPPPGSPRCRRSRPSRSEPKRPPTRCTAMTSSASSNPNRPLMPRARKHTMPATKPMSIGGMRADEAGARGDGDEPGHRAGRARRGSWRGRP